MGQFSWKTQDTHRPIYNDWDEHGDQQTIHMVDPRDGTDYKEEGYEGYGIFGGRDFYELLADINKDAILKMDLLRNMNCKEAEEKYNKILQKMDDIIAGKTTGNVVEVVKELKKAMVEMKPMCNLGHDDLEKLLSKPFKDLTEQEIDDKRQVGIDFWFANVEIEHFVPGEEDDDVKISVKNFKAPILVENYDTWKRYNSAGCYPESDPNQGWHMGDDDDDQGGW